MSALTLSHYPRSACVYCSSPAPSSPPWACLQNPQSASSPLEPPPAPVSLPLGRLSQSRHLPFRTAPETQPSGARLSFSFFRQDQVENRNYAEVHAAGACSRPIFGVPTGLRTAPRSHHASPGVCLRKPPAQPGLQPHRGTTGFGEMGFRLCYFAVMGEEVRRERELGQVHGRKTRPQSPDVLGSSGSRGEQTR